MNKMVNSPGRTWFTVSSVMPSSLNFLTLAEFLPSVASFISLPCKSYNRLSIASNDACILSTISFKSVIRSGINILICCHFCLFLSASQPLSNTEKQTQIVVTRKQRQVTKVLRDAVLFNAVWYLSLDSAHSCTLGINSLVGEPQVGVNMLDVTHGVAILNVRNTHPIHLFLHTWVQLFLEEGDMMKQIKFYMTIGWFESFHH